MINISIILLKICRPSISITWKVVCCLGNTFLLSYMCCSLSFQETRFQWETEVGGEKRCSTCQTILLVGCNCLVFLLLPLFSCSIFCGGNSDRSVVRVSVGNWLSGRWDTRERGRQRERESPFIRSFFLHLRDFGTCPFSLYNHHRKSSSKGSQRIVSTL